MKVQLRTPDERACNSLNPERRIPCDL